MTAPEFEPLLTSDEVAKILQCSTRTLTKLRQSGELGYTAGPGRGTTRPRIYYRHADIKAYLKSRQVPVNRRKTA